MFVMVGGCTGLHMHLWVLLIRQTMKWRNNHRNHGRRHLSPPMYYKQVLDLACPLSCTICLTASYYLCSFDVILIVGEGLL